MDALIFLGTSGGIPMLGRHFSSLLLESEGCRWLLDAGEPCTARLLAMGVPLASLDAIFISHGHSDHISGLPMLIQGAWLERKRRRPLPIYLPGELIAPLKAWLNAVYLPEKLIGFAIEYHAWESLAGAPVPLDGGRVRVSVNPTSHLDGLRTLIDESAAERFRAYSMAFDWQGGKRLIYSADLGRPEDLAALLTQPCNLLVCELAHFAPKDLFHFLEDKPWDRLALTHLSAEASAQAEKIVALGTRMLPGKGEMMVVEDGLRVEF